MYIKELLCCLHLQTSQHSKNSGLQVSGSRTRGCPLSQDYQDGSSSAEYPSTCLEIYWSIRETLKNSKKQNELCLKISGYVISTRERKGRDIWKYS